MPFGRVETCNLELPFSGRLQGIFRALKGPGGELASLVLIDIMEIIAPHEANKPRFFSIPHH
jgi:hypothetical protein